jgi:hypothetical protein
MELQKLNSVSLSTTKQAAFDDFIAKTLSENKRI